jgi:hypothetical protein
VWTAPWQGLSDAFCRIGPVRSRVRPIDAAGSGLARHVMDLGGDVVGEAETEVEVGVEVIGDLWPAPGLDDTDLKRIPPHEWRYLRRALQ